MFIEDAFRPFWAPELNDIVINKSTSLGEYIKAGKDYQINTQVLKDEFKLDFFNRVNFLNPISYDCNRFSSSSLESILKIDDFTILPKSIGWILIKQYYSAFYSAHLILRILGFALSQLDQETINTVKKVADLYANLNGVNIENGYFLIDYSKNFNSLHCKKINVNQDGGSHVVLWKFFGEKIKEVSLEMLKLNSSTTIQQVVAKLDDLISNLDYVGSNNHSWLSRVRNDLNYKHFYGVWHPYNLPKDQLESIKRNINLWKTDILKIDLRNHIGSEMVRFSNTCHFIIGLGAVICEDMSTRCSLGKSFLRSGYNQLINMS